MITYVGASLRLTRSLRNPLEHWNLIEKHEVGKSLSG
jgi:hypothetical protein